MDTKIEIKEEVPLSDDVASQNETEFFIKNVVMKTNSNAVHLNDDCDMEIKSEAPFPDFCLQKGGEFHTKQLEKQIKSETVTCCNNYETNTKTEIEEETLVPDFGSQNERKFLQEDPVRKDEKYNSDHEMDNKIEIKEEYCWLETENSYVCNEITNEDFPPVNSPRSCIEAVSGDSSDKSPIHEVKRSYKCKICEKRFIWLSHLKRHNLIHEGTKPYKCEICDKRFTLLSSLKRHNLIHEGKKPHKCGICEKRFTLLSHLKTHNLIHEGKKPYKCVICEKRFTLSSSFKRHNLIHEGKKPHKCEICDKRFTQLSHLKSHNLIHEDRNSYRCSICEKRFTQFSDLKRHNLIHEGKQPHKCSICEKKFTQFSDLKRHHLIHEGKQPHM